MGHVLRYGSYVRVVNDGDSIVVDIQVGNAQLGQWKVSDAGGIIAQGTATPASVPLGNGAARRNTLIKIEVVCQDQNPSNDYLSAIIDVNGIVVPVHFTPNNEGEESPQCTMTAVCDVYFM